MPHPAAAPFDLRSIGAGLPAAQLVPQITAWLGNQGEQGGQSGARGLRGVVVAPPGTGKTTLVPPLAANLLAERAASSSRTGASGAGAERVIVTQPRRIAARSAARRLAALTGTAPGELSGFTVRGERRCGPGTRVEFVTTGVLLRRLIRDPDLPGVGAVILDEVHERHLDSDLAFAMLRQLLDLREDLGLLVMSATVDAHRWARLLGDDDDAGPAPTAEVAAEIHPLEQRWAPFAGRALEERGVADGFLRHVAETVRGWFAGASENRADARSGAGGVVGPAGDCLVFLPGAREIERVAQRLRADPPRHRPEILTLAGRTPAAEQDRILDPRRAGTGRIILATNVAESALTVPGVRVVVDSGLDRQQRLDTVRGMSGLVTVGASKAAMTQRAGRAAREAPGSVIRCLSEADHAARPAHTPPEIQTADLTGAVLDLACWGAPGGVGLRLPDPLPERALAAARRTLEGLGALDDAGTATDLGHRLAVVPADPRLARGLFDGAELVGTRAAAEVVAALASDRRAPGGDLWALVQDLRRDGDRTWRREVERFEGLLGAGGSGAKDDSSRRGALAGRASEPGSAPQGSSAPQGRAPEGGAPADGFESEGRAPADQTATALVTALAFPRQIARRRPDSERDYLLASGTGARLPRDSSLTGAEWLAVAEAGLAGGHPLLRAAASIDRETAELAAGPLLMTEQRGEFARGKVTAREVVRLGAIELSTTPVRPTPAVGRGAVARALRERGLVEFLQVSEGFETLRARLGLLWAAYGDPWPEVTIGALEDAADEWLGPELEQIAGGAPVGKVDAVSALRRLLPWPEAARLDELVPERVTVPSGSVVRLRYPAPEEHGAGELESDARDGDAGGESAGEAGGGAGGWASRTDGRAADGEAARNAGRGARGRAGDVVPPVLAVKLQECFGWDAGPAVCEGRVPALLHLLSPARRPLAVTQDLRSFWENAYPQVRAENRGRYSKHPWPEDPWNAAATARTKPRR